jgi:hypothetical protein
VRLRSWQPRYRAANGSGAHRKTDLRELSCGLDSCAQDLESAGWNWFPHARRCRRAGRLGRLAQSLPRGSGGRALGAGGCGPGGAGGFGLGFSPARGSTGSRGRPFCLSPRRFRGRGRWLGPFGRPCLGGPGLSGAVVGPCVGGPARGPGGPIRARRTLLAAAMGAGVRERPEDVRGPFVGHRLDMIAHPRQACGAALPAWRPKGPPGGILGEKTTYVDAFSPTFGRTPRLGLWNPVGRAHATPKTPWSP